MQSIQEPRLEHSQSERAQPISGDLTPSSRNSFEHEESKNSHEKNQLPTFFEKQQSETLILYNSCSTILQMALASKTSVAGIKYQIMQDLITISKRPSMKEYLTSNTALDFKETPPFVISAPSQALMELGNLEHESADDDDNIEYVLDDEDVIDQQEDDDDEANWSDDT
mgnify:CR=1 FL=1